MHEEITHTDHIYPPYARNFDLYGELDVPIRVTSLGHYREGIHFSQFSYGFDNYGLGLTLGGTAEKTMRDIKRELRRGDIVFCHNYEPIDLRATSAEWRIMFINVRGYDLKLFDKLWNGDGFEVIHTDHTDFFEEAFDKIDALVGLGDIKSNLEISSIVTSLLTRILNQREARGEGSAASLPAWIPEAKLYISAHCTEDIRIEDVAERFHVSHSTFTRLFKKHTAKTPKEFQMLCRIDSAAILLRTTNMTIAEISAETGFTSHSFLTKLFTQIYGVSPSKWRNIRIHDSGT